VRAGHVLEVFKLQNEIFISPLHEKKEKKEEKKAVSKNSSGLILQQLLL